MAFGLAACNYGETFNISELTENSANSSQMEIGERWLSEILHSMQGETGTYLRERAEAHSVQVSYSDDLQHRIGEFNPSTNLVTLELPYGIETASEEEFQEMVLTGRRVMYEELDHAVRYHERTRINGLSAQDSVDGVRTANESIARITAFIGMSEDAQLGSAPSLKVQLGMPGDGRAVYYSIIDAEMADVIIGGLEEGEFFHEKPELIDDVFSAFYGTSTSEWYTLQYTPIPNDVISEYTLDVSLAEALDNYRDGRDLTFNELTEFSSGIVDGAILLANTEAQFEKGDFTSEAESLSLNDLIRHRHRMSLPDSGRANHLNRTVSSGNFFRDAPSSRIVEAFEILVSDTTVIRDFMASCVGKDYLSENTRNVVANNYQALSEYLPVVTSLVNNVRQAISGQELDAQTRIQLELLYRRAESPLVTPSSNRVAIYNAHIRGNRDDGIRLCL